MGDRTIIVVVALESKIFKLHRDICQILTQQERVNDPQAPQYATGYVHQKELQANLLLRTKWLGPFNNHNEIQVIILSAKSKLIHLLSSNRILSIISMQVFVALWCFY